MTTGKPSLELVRSLTDELVLRALMRERRLTRAEISARTGISKPTASESVRRLLEAALVSDSGERTTGRGRVGTYYALAADLGTALVVSIAPEGVVAQSVEVHGDVVARAQRPVERPARPADVARALTGAARQALGAGAPAGLAVVSAADPVDRATGRLVHLPDAPFLLGELDPVEVLAPLVDGPVLVDNDVNWAARAERDAGGAALADFAYLHLGEGLGCAVVADGEVRRGHGGLAGEIAHLVTTGPSGHARAFTEVFGDLGLRQDGSTAVDVPALLAAVTGSSAEAERARQALGRAVAGVLTAVVALTDPSTILLGGAWGSHPAVLEAVTRRSGSLPRRTEVRPCTVDAEPALTAATARALEDLRLSVVERARVGGAPPARRAHRDEDVR